MPIAKKRVTKKSKPPSKTNTWKVLNDLHDRYPATLLSIVAIAVIIPIGLISLQTSASVGEQVTPLELRLVAPSSNAIASKTVALRGKFQSGDPRRVAFVIDGNPVKTISASPSEHGVWEALWDTSSLQNGDHTVSLRAENNEASAMTGTVHVNVQNTHPILRVNVNQPEAYEVATTDPLTMHASILDGATDVSFVVSKVFMGKDGHREVSPVGKFTATAEDATMQHWSATTNPLTIVPHADGMFQVQALAKRDGFSDTMSPGVPMILSSTSTKVSVAGSLQADEEVNFLDVDISDPVQGESVSGTVTIVSAGTPIDAVVALKVSVWDGKGYVRDLPASNIGGTWTAKWATTDLPSGWYWIQSQAYGPAFVPSLSEPVLVHLPETP